MKGSNTNLSVLALVAAVFSVLCSVFTIGLAVHYKIQVDYQMDEQRSIIEQLSAENQQLEGSVDQLIEENQQLRDSIDVVEVKVERLSETSSFTHQLIKRSVNIQSPEDENANESGTNQFPFDLRGPPGRDGRDGRDCDYSIITQIVEGLQNNDREVEDSESIISDALQAVNRTLGASLRRHLSRSAERIGVIEEQMAGGTGASSNRTGATYIRWGRTVCPDDSERLYEGFVGGQVWDHTGGSSVRVCLPLEPEWLSYTTHNEASNWIYGAEYEIGDYLTENGIFPSNFHNRNVPCASCYSAGRTTSIMIPAKTSCPDSTWTKEYQGYLMSERYNHPSSAAYTCVDTNPETLAGSHFDIPGATFYFVQTKCSSTLHCPPYIDGAELTCVICTK